MPRRAVSISEDQPTQDGAPVQPEGEDTEGHMLQLDPNTARNLARARSADVDRDLRDRQRQKEARPNRR
jgi:hypothetical protein